jgi:DNA polymerase III subunit gamma/tau
MSARSAGASPPGTTLEIDGASNRRIDDIRDIRANVSVKSMRSRYKIYIIDEVHMLTTEAFNALLKTLEEPPPNVKFVFCTTEPAKVPDTILSRCQRFDFSTIETQNISERLKQIAEAEGYTVEDAALDLVARRAAGSMRDSQSLFDQLLAFGEKNLTSADVHRLLGTADDQRLIDLFQAATDRNPQRMFELLDQTLSAGVQLGELIAQLLGYARDLMIVASGAEKVSLQSVFNSHRPTLREQAERWGLETIVTAMQILADTKTQMGRSVNARPIAELALIRLCQLGDLKSLASALRQMESGGGAVRVSASPATRSAAVVNEKKNEPLSTQTFIPQDVNPTGSPPATASAPPSSEGEAASASSTEPQLELTEGSRTEFWARILERLDSKIQLHLNSCSNTAIIGPNQLEIVFPVEYDLSRRYCEKPDNLKAIESAASGLAGRAIQIRLNVDRNVTPVSGTGDVADHRQPPIENGSVPDLDAVEDQYVRQTAEIFGATLVKVQSLGTTPPSGEG